MNHSGREDRKLSEVKAVLRHLQGLPSEPERSGAPSGKTGARSPLRLGGAIGIAVAVVAVVLVFAYAFPRSGDKAKSAAAKGNSVAMPAPGSKDEPLTIVPKGSLRPAAMGESGSAPPPDAPAGTPDDAKPGLEAAKALLKSGRVRQARERLLALTAHGSSDVIWTLARSYDPNSLKEIPRADSPSDIEEATRWYRIWYGMAVKEGLVRDSVSLERIIGSMKK